MKETIPCCFHPTKAVFIDDNESFVSNINLKIDPTIATQLFTNPKHALKFLNEDYHSPPFTARCVSHPEEDEGDHRMIDVDLRAIHQEIYHPQRFDQISVVVVDYSMPGMNGLEFCQKLNNPLIKKIMLTGEADEKLAIEAFNAGIIDHFLTKQTENISNKLSETIHTMQKLYFQELSETINSTLIADIEASSRCLADPAFIALFESILQKKKIREYYITDECGSFLMLDIKGQPSWLAVRTARDLKAYAQTSEFAEAPESITNPLAAHEKLAYFFSDEDLNTCPSQWEPFLHKATVLKGLQDYYYAFIDGSKPYQINQNSVLAYNDYLFSL